ncbi:MAG: prolipoprotein diacylglyceryl transferase, partial [Lachnospiraceae bacterium]|nr:prolipoprotein diacylglyceryl transferase [Lachnospiraceae bacterium]
VKLWPTQLFSAAGNFVIAGILFLAVYVIKVKKKGNIAVLYLLLYSVGRFLVEFLRNDARGSVGALSTSQFIAIFTFVAGIALGVYINIVKKDSQSEKNEQKSEK